MRIVANLAMLACWLFLAFGVGVIVIATALGHYEAFYDIFDLPLGMTPPATAWIALASALIIVSLLLLGVAFLSFSQVLLAAERADFDKLGIWMGRGGVYLIAFWAVYQIVSRIMPFPLVAALPFDQRPEIEWVPLDLDVILLVLGFVLWSVAGTMRKAAEIAHENSQFL